MGGEAGVLLEGRCRGKEKVGKRWGPAYEMGLNSFCVFVEWG